MRAEIAAERFAIPHRPKPPNRKQLTTRDTRNRLDSFTAQVFSSFARSDQRAVGGLYLRGLMLDGRRKSMQLMAARLGVDHQRLQQFITDSPWDVAAVRKTLAGLAHSVCRVRLKRSTLPLCDSPARPNSA
jgi:SRSO17 transposase